MAPKGTRLIKAKDRNVATTGPGNGSRPATQAEVGLPADGGPTDPSAPSLAWKAMIDKWRLIQTVSAGTLAMREAAEEYLPQHPNEEALAYQERLQISVLYNVYRLTRESLVGKVFVEPMGVSFGDNKEPDPFWTSVLKDFDKRGTNAHSFMRQWFSVCMDDGYGGVFIDMPKRKDTPGRRRTRKDDLDEKARPFGSIIRGSRILGVDFDDATNVEVMTRLRLHESAIVKEGYSEEVRDRVRVVTNEAGVVSYVLYEKRKVKGKDLYFEIENGVYDIDEIPFWIFFCDEEGSYDCNPPLLDLAHLNVTHWQSTSDQRIILTVARFPMLAMSGGIEQANGGKINVGPRQVLHTRDPNGRFYYVEHNGKAIEVGAKDIDELEKRMASYGAEFLRKRVSNVTATERVLDTTESMSALKDMGLRFTDAIIGAFKLIANWAKKDFEAEVSLNLDFTQDDSNANDLQHLAQMRMNGDISLEDYVQALIRFDVLDEHTDVDAFCARVRKEYEDADARELKKAADTAALQLKNQKEIIETTAKNAPKQPAAKPANQS